MLDERHSAVSSARMAQISANGGLQGRKLHHPPPHILPLLSCALYLLLGDAPLHIVNQ